MRWYVRGDTVGTLVLFQGNTTEERAVDTGGCRTCSTGLWNVLRRNGGGDGFRCSRTNRR